MNVEHRDQLPADTAREGVHPGDELVHGKWLAEVVVGAEHQAFDALGNFATSGEQEHGHRVALIAQQFQDAQAVGRPRAS